MHINWTPVVLIVAVCITGGVITSNLASATRAAQEITGEVIKPDNVISPRKHTRKEICTGLIDDIKRAYKRDVKSRGAPSRQNLMETIQIYNGVRGDLFCRKDVFKILEEVNHYGK